MHFELIFFWSLSGQNYYVCTNQRWGWFFLCLNNYTKILLAENWKTSLLYSALQPLFATYTVSWKNIQKSVFKKKEIWKKNNMQNKSNDSSLPKITCLKIY